MWPPGWQRPWRSTGSSAASRRMGGAGARSGPCSKPPPPRTGADDILGVQKRLVKPVTGLSDDDIAFLRDEFDRLNVRDPDLAPYIALVAMGRLERPWEALRLAAVLSRKATDTLMANTD